MLWIKAGTSVAGTELLLTKADTMSAVISMISDLSSISALCPWVMMRPRRLSRDAGGALA
jgi:hypothetical protein